MCMHQCMQAHWLVYNAVVGEQIPYESQHKSNGSGKFADFCTISNSTLFSCNVTTTCQDDPLVVKCSKGKSNLYIPLGNELN